MNREMLKFVEFAGTKANAARMLSMSNGYISLVCSGQRGVSPKVALKIEKLTRGLVSKEKLIWGSRVRRYPELSDTETTENSRD